MVPPPTNLLVEDAPNPLEYPWNPPSCSGIMSDNRFFDFALQMQRRLGQSHVRLADNGTHADTQSVNQYLVESNIATIDARFLVVAVGSNASPAVMRRKFAKYAKPISLVLPFVRGTIQGIDVGHSAHCSAGGYIAAAPFAKPSSTTTLWASWLDLAQLEALDTTESNYVRVLVQRKDYPFELENGETPESYYIYESKHGLISEEGVTRALTSQTEIFTWLQLRSVFAAPSDESPEQVVQSLRGTAAGAALKTVLKASKLVSPSGIRSTPLGSSNYGHTRSLFGKPAPDSADAQFDGLRIVASPDDLPRRGEQCVVVHPADKAKLGLGSHAVAGSCIPTDLAYSIRPGLVVRVVASTGVTPGTVQTDQIVRNGLGVEKQEHLTLNRCETSNAVLGNVILGGPNFVACRVQSADLSSVEQEVCLLEPLAMRFLGINQGDVVVIEGVPLEGERSVTRIRLRACELDTDVSSRRISLSGGGLESRFPDPSDALGVFPDLPRIFLDSAARTRLGLGSHKLTVVRIRPSRRFQLQAQMRELLLILVLAFIGLMSFFDDPAVVGILLIGIIAIAILVIHGRLRSQLGLRGIMYGVGIWLTGKKSTKSK